MTISQHAVIFPDVRPDVWRSITPLPRATASAAPVQRFDEPDAAIIFDCVTTRGQFDRLERDWRRLFERAGRGSQVFQTFDWLWHWCNHFLDNQECTTDLHIVTGRRNGDLVVVWPLAVQRCRGLRHLVWMGQPVSQYGDALVDQVRCRHEDLKRSWQFAVAAAQVDVIHLRKVRADAACASVLQSSGASQVAMESAPFLDFTGVDSFESYQRRYSGKARKNRRRLRRRMAERAPLTSKTVTDGAHRGGLAETAVVMKRTWLQARGLVSPALHSDKTRAFFRDAAASSSHPTGARTSVLKVGSQPAALQVSFVAKAHCAVHIIVYNLDFEKAGAGVLLMEDMIASAIDSGVETLDLLAPGDSYKLDWADGAIDVCDWTLALTRVGRLHNALKLNLLPKLTKTLLLALPLAIRRLLTVNLQSS